MQRLEEAKSDKYFEILNKEKARTFVSSSKTLGDTTMFFDWGGNIWKVRHGVKKPLWKTSLKKEGFKGEIGVPFLYGQKVLALGTQGLFEIMPEGDIELRLELEKTSGFQTLIGNQLYLCENGKKKPNGKFAPGRMLLLNLDTLAITEIYAEKEDQPGREPTTASEENFCFFADRKVFGYDMRQGSLTVIYENPEPCELTFLSSVGKDLYFFVDGKIFKYEEEQEKLSQIYENPDFHNLTSTLRVGKNLLFITALKSRGAGGYSNRDIHAAVFKMDENDAVSEIPDTPLFNSYYFGSSVTLDSGKGLGVLGNFLFKEEENGLKKVDLPLERSGFSSIATSCYLLRKNGEILLFRPSYPKDADKKDSVGGRGFELYRLQADTLDFEFLEEYRSHDDGFNYMPVSFDFTDDIISVRGDRRCYLLRTSSDSGVKK